MVLAFLALVRGITLVRHDPLLALANNYDQIRYTICLDIAPWRPGVDPAKANPPAPYSRFAFAPLPNGICAWSSDLLFTAPLALAWHASEAMGGRAIHSVRRLGELRLVGWFAVGAWATWFFLRERRVDLALAHLAGFALFAMDPANTLYLSTFYAEGAAAFGFYVCLVGIAAALVRPTRGALATAAAGAMILATSKYQHVMLPIALGIAVLIGAARSGRKVAFAVLVAGALGAGIQLASGARDTPSLRYVHWVNSIDYTLGVLLPETSDRDRIVRTLAVNDACLEYVGKSVYAMPGSAEKTCTSAPKWHSAELWWLLVSDPPAFARALLHVPRWLLPWQPRYLGVVEDGNNEHQPGWMPSLDLLFGERPLFAWTLLALPWLVVIATLRRGTPPLARAVAFVCAIGMVEVCLAALFGDGDVEYAKHVHLGVNYALASLSVPIAWLFRRALAAKPA
ncbi:MAG TPA: hypothetical protein VFV97_10560 [Rhodanobacteraceae bacterium]|nr:hypothetical protein [Rhodanobacteraceae bacterium]